MKKPKKTFLKKVLFSNFPQNTALEFFRAKKLRKKKRGFFFLILFLTN
jgi:hypothetical protein